MSVVEIPTIEPVKKADDDQVRQVRLRRLAVEIVSQLPHDIDDAVRTLAYANQLLLWK